MVQAWYMDDSNEDQRSDHHLNPPQYVSLEELKTRTGVLYWKIDVSNPEGDPLLDTIRKDRGYTYCDELICCPEKLPNYEEKIKDFFKEHIHSDEEIRLVNEGSGYFDVRDNEDKWIRIHVHQGDLLILPAGIYHRFTLDTNNFIRAKRLFVGEPVWIPINRPADDHPARLDYLQTITS